MVKAYGTGIVGIRILRLFPFLDPAERLNLLNSTGGVVEPKWINLGLLTQEDQGMTHIYNSPLTRIPLTFRTPFDFI